MTEPVTDSSSQRSSCFSERNGDLQKSVGQVFKSQFAVDSTILAAAPGRVNLIGEHIDYNDGFVLPMAIDRYALMAASPREESSPPGKRTARIYSVDFQNQIEFAIDSRSKPTVSNWGRYVEGVVAGFAGLGLDIPSFDAVLASNVPAGGGLSSSAAIEVATATMLESLTGHTLPLKEKALLCQRAEHQFAGVPCGIMDQFSSIFGQPNELMLLDCINQTIKPVAFKADEVSVLITNSNVAHELSGGEYAHRRSDCEMAKQQIGTASWREVTSSDFELAKSRLTDSQFACARHVITEIKRTLLASEAFDQRDWSQVGSLMYESHASLQRDYKVSCHELDVLVEIAREIGQVGGVFGSRMTGGGFGGCTVSLVKTSQVDAVKERILAQYKSKTGIQATSFKSLPARGAHLLQG